MLTQSALRSPGIRTFLTIWLGQVFSIVGSGLTGFALSIWIYERTDSVSLLAFNLLALALPGIIFAPLIGMITDRYNRRIVMIAADLGAGVSTLIVLLLVLNGNLETWHIYVTTFIRAAFTALQWPAYQASVPLLVPQEHLGRAGGLSQVGEAISYLIGPALAGALYVMPNVGFAGVIAIDLATMVFGILTMLLVRIPDVPRSEQEPASESFWSEVTVGWRYIRERKGLLGLMAMFALLNFFQEFSAPLVQPLMLNLAEPNQVGLALSIMAVGFMVGIAIITIWGGPKNRVIGMLGGILIGGIAIGTAGLRPSVVLITLGGFIYFTAWPIIDSMNHALWQKKVTPSVQGRVFATRSAVTSSVRPLALLLAGPLADGVFEPLMRVGGPLASTVGTVIGVGHGRGIGLFLIVIGIMTTLTAMVALFYRPIQRIESDIADAVFIPDAGSAAEPASS